MSLRKQTAAPCGRARRMRPAPINDFIFNAWINPWIRGLAASLMLWPVLASAAESGPSVDQRASTDSPRFSAPAAAFTIFSDASDDAKQALQWVSTSEDNRSLPFAIVDKKAARIYVFEGDGQLRGASPALLGQSPGDGALVSLVNRPVSSLALDERTTPAGRFASEPGHNLNGEAIVWMDYAAKLAIHRLRPADPREHRAERLASSTADDNRISFGCVIVPVSFYESVIAPSLGKSQGVVYVLPETEDLQRVFNGLQSAQVSLQAQ
jgi:hypothetical protein